MVYRVLKDEIGRLKRARVWQHEALCIIGLYQQGRSINGVADLTGHTLDVVRNLLHEAGVTRSRGDSISLSMRRTAARARLTEIDIRALALRWMDGAEVENLAKPYDVPADLLWEAMADELSNGDPRKPVKCVGVCTLSCTNQCAIELPVKNHGAATKRGDRPGIPYARIGLRLPEPGSHSRFGP